MRAAQVVIVLGAAGGLAYARFVAPLPARTFVVRPTDHRTLDVFDLIYEMEDGRLAPPSPPEARAPGVDSTTSLVLGCS